MTTTTYHEDPAAFYEEDPAYAAFIEAEAARGELAFHAETAECYECGGFDGKTFIVQPVVKLGRVVNPADPTQTYVLACGHVAI